MKISAIMGGPDCGKRNNVAMDTRWLSARLALVGQKKGDLAEALSINPSAVTRIFNGERKIQSHEIPIMAKFLDVTQEELLTRLSDDGTYKDISGTEITQVTPTESAASFPLDEGILEEAIEWAVQINGGTGHVLEVPEVKRLILMRYQNQLNEKIRNK